MVWRNIYVNVNFQHGITFPNFTYDIPTLSVIKCHILCFLHSYFLPHVALTLSIGGLKVTCEYVAHQEGVLCEEMLIVSESKEDVCLKVKVHARVMGKLMISAAQPASKR